MLENKKINIIISLLIAVALWAFVIYATDPVQTKVIKDVPVELVNTELVEARGLTAADSGSITVDINVEASRSVLAQMTPDQISATADVSDCIEGDNTIAVDVSFMQDAHVYGDLTVTVRVRFEKIVTESRPVTVIYKMKGSRTADASVSEDMRVDITGAQSAVDRVESAAVIIRRDDIEGKSGVIYKEIYPVDSEGEVVKDITLSEKYASVTVTPYNEKTVRLITGTEGEPAAGYELGNVEAPETVVIMGSEEALSEVDSVKADPFDISGLTASTDFDISASLPEGCVLASDQDLTATVHIYKQGAERKSYTFGIDEISFENLDSGLEVSECDNVKITGMGLIKADIHVTADLEGLSEGSHEVQVTVENKEGDIISYTPKVITLTLVGK